MLERRGGAEPLVAGPIAVPHEPADIVSGRVANILNLRGPNFITDAACASSFAAVEAGVQMLANHKVDAVITGGVDRKQNHRRDLRDGGECVGRPGGRACGKRHAQTRAQCRVRGRAPAPRFFP